MALTQVGTQNNFAVPAGWPVTLIVRATDDCGEIAGSASMAASFSNGDPPISLVGDNVTGTYSATWQPGRVTQQLTVTVDATSTAFPLTTTQLVGTVGQNVVNPPVLAANGTLNNLTFVVGAPLAPNTVAAVFGANMAAAASPPLPAPLPTAYSGTTMLLGGLEAPLYFVSPGQLVVQIPPELAPNQQYAAIINANGALTLPDTVTLVPAQPGIAAFPDGTIKAQHAADFALVDATRPAKPGEVIIVYLAGMGPTNPAVTSGKPSPDREPFARVTVPPKVTIDGQEAGVGFAGLSPGFVGLYQINVQIPANARAGDLELIVTQGTAVSNKVKVPVAP